MIVKVHLLAFTDGEIREVEVPELDTLLPPTNDDELGHVLELVFHWGQNDFQPQQKPSVSVGDVIEMDGRFHRVESVGFKELTADQMADWRGLSVVVRAMQSYGPVPKGNES